MLVGAVEGPGAEWSPAPPVRVIEARAPRSVREIRHGVWIADFGQNASGWLRLTDLGPEGTMTAIDYGEHVGTDGDLSTTHLDSERPGEPPLAFVQHDEVIAGAAGEVFEPRHTIHGFQYVRITRTGTPLDPASVTMQIVHTDLRRTGTFACSDEDLNRLHEIADWSFRGNAVDVPTDCPTRERLAWTGDYQIFAPRRRGCYDVLGFSRKWLRSVRDDQLDDGRIANFSPDGRRIKHHLDDQFAMMTGSAGWGDAIVAVPWELYETYGDEEVLAENWDAMARWVEWALEKARTERHHSRVQAHPQPEPFEEFLWDGTFHWGEWTEPKERAADGTPIDPIKHNPMAWFMADKGEVGTAYLYRSTATLARAAAVLGRADDAARYARIAEQVRAAWQAAYLHADGTTRRDTQASYVRALSFGLVPDELRDAAASRLVDLIRSADTHLRTGFLSTGDLLPCFRHRPRRRRVRAALPAHRAVVAEHDRPRRDDDLGGLGGRRRVRRRARVAQPLQQGRGDPLPAHPHPRAAAGAGLGGVGVGRHRAGARARRSPGRADRTSPRRAPSGWSGASRTTRSASPPKFRRRQPPASCSPTAPRTAGPGRFRGQPKPAASLHRHGRGELIAAGATPITTTIDREDEDDHFPRGLPVGRGYGRAPDRRQQRQQRLVGARAADAGHGAVRRRLRQLPPLRGRHPAARRRRPDRLPIQPGVVAHRADPRTFSKAELAHYRRVIDACLDRGVTPVVTLQHFTTPQWFAEAGGWSGAGAPKSCSRGTWSRRAPSSTASSGSPR